MIFFNQDGANLTWIEPAPTQVVQAAVNPVKLFSTRQLFQGTINATLSWQFGLAELTFKSSVVFFEGKSVARVSSSVTGTPPSCANRFGLDWDIKQNLLTLFIFNVTAKENGTFSFRVTADSLDGYSEFQFTNNVQVDVVGPPSNIVTSSNQTITAPAELALKCSADGIPKPTITWTTLSDNTAVTMPLTISRRKDEEIYRCTASNGVGKPLTEDVYINILFSPKVTLAEKFFVGRGRNASLICQVEGNPKPAISWSPCVDLPNAVCDKQYLNISKVQTPRANYNCTARNAVGIDSATTVLIIGGYKIYLSIGIIEECDKKSSVWEELKRELINVFEKTTQDFSGVELIVARKLIFDMVFTFSTEVAEDDTISIIQNSIVDGKLGGVNVKTSHIIGISAPFTPTTRAPTRTTSKSDDNTELIIGVVLGSVAFVALIVFIIWYLRKKKCCFEAKGEEVSYNTDSAQGRKGKGQNGSDEVASASISMLPHSKRPEEKNNQSTMQALPMYAQVVKTEKTSNKGGAAQSRLPLKWTADESLLNGQCTTKRDGWSTISTAGRERNCKLDETRLRWL